MDEKLYKVRIVIPKDAENAKAPAETFIVQESSSTGFRNDGDPGRVSIGATDHDYHRNPRFISTCITGSAGIVTVTTELPHTLQVGNLVNIVNVRSTTNTGFTNKGYNGRFTVDSIIDDSTFTYSSTDVLGVVHTPGTFTNDTSTRGLNLPRFEKNDVNKNYFVYRSEIIRPYIKDVQDGIYHAFVLNSNNAISEEFTGFKYGQNVTDLYPQLDKDNIDDNPRAIKSFAVRNPIGEVVSNDRKKSLTKETLDLFALDFGFGKKISGVTTVFSTPTSGTATLTLDREHGFAGVNTYSSFSGGSGYIQGTHFNVKLLNNGSTAWDGATAKVVVSSGGTITDVDILSPGSGYTDAEEVSDFDTSVIGLGVGAGLTISASGISTNIGDVLQVTGIGTTGDGYYRIASIPSKTQVAVAITDGDPQIHTEQYVVNCGPSVPVSSVSTPVSGITTVTTGFAHNLTSGSKLRVVDSSHSHLGDFVVNEKVGVTTFTLATSNTLSSAAFVLKHGFDSNNAASDATNENLGSRSVLLYENNKFFLGEELGTGNNVTIEGNAICGIATLNTFSLGSYIQIDNEILRISNSEYVGSNNNELTVLRGVFGTPKENHASGSIARKIKPPAIELRRPSIIRASGHTFEYLGFGPGNYSTGLPQVQVRSLTEQESFLAQSQKKASGVVVYTGMNSDGDFYIGNKKASSATGQEVTFDVPVATVTGQDVGRLSVVFDEVLIKERLRVEGGKSGTVLSQFDGPVTFNNQVRIRNTATITGVVKLTDITQSTSKTTGALVVAGGIGVDGKATIDDVIVANTGIIPDVDKGAYIGTVGGAFEEAYIDGIRLGVGGTTTIDTRGGDLVISAAIGSSVSISTITTISADLNVTGDITAFYTSDERLKDNVTPIDDPLAKVLSISGNTYDWNEKSGKSGDDVGVIAQEVLEVLPQAVTTRDNGYLAVDYQRIVPLLVEAVKELSARVQDLEQNYQINNSKAYNNGKF